MATTTNEKVVICIGDIHGYINKLKNLWSNLEKQIKPNEFESAHVIFLGDYCDHGPHTREVLDFLISLPSRYPRQSHVFLAGNHDYGFAAFVGALPQPPEGSEFCSTWDRYKGCEEVEGWYKGPGYETMHVQGRRWGGEYKVKYHVSVSSVYNFIKAIPNEHKKFLANMAWIYEEEDVCINTNEGTKRCKLIAVHAGLENGKDVEEQMIPLRERDTKIPRLTALSGRNNVLNMPEELAKHGTILVSGHHGKLHIEGLRFIIDEGDGLKRNTLAAIVLPSMKIVRDTDAEL
ncbi:hypothetical protein CTI12_AA320670 [Artemisia annua]|uniref:Calcineurin-like phosphoesterase domain-containing protein n=1 Tax=Artemisia annua TaxID=35608 RepID=A0A2U1N0X6_ARTAN|nr:hypothetical protein CTI12_AA320670 [Artemisia annua]